MTYADIKVVFSGPGDVNLEADGVVVSQDSFSIVL